MHFFPLSSALVLLLASSDAYQPTPNKVAGRRDLFRSAAGAAFIGVGTVVGISNLPANAIDACPKGSNNCIRTTWTPPSGTSKKDAAQQLKALFDSYPNEGQDKVDLGGWSFAQDSLASSGTARLEYQSGIGNFAKFLNGGNPFVDDLEVEVGDSGTTEVRSASRVGESDFKVNQKRLAYFAKKLNDLGWNAPEPTY